MVHLARHEHNAWLHAAATIGVVAAGVVLRIELADWRWLALAIALVWLCESFNTAIERLCDVVTIERNTAIGTVKDLAAGGVLIAALFAAVIGLLVFVPRLI